MGTEKMGEMRDGTMNMNSELGGCSWRGGQKSKAKQRKAKQKMHATHEDTKKKVKMQ